MKSATEAAQTFALQAGQQCQPERTARKRKPVAIADIIDNVLNGASRIPRAWSDQKGASAEN